MHTEHDTATAYATLSAYTGKSVRYYRIRAYIRALVAVGPITAAFISVLATH